MGFGQFMDLELLLQRHPKSGTICKYVLFKEGDLTKLAENAGHEALGHSATVLEKTGDLSGSPFLFPGELS